MKNLFQARYNTKHFTCIFSFNSLCSPIIKSLKLSFFGRIAKFWQISSAWPGVSGASSFNEY